VTIAVPAVVGFLAVACFLAVFGVHALTGVPAVAGFDAVTGVPAADGVDTGTKQKQFYVGVLTGVNDIGHKLFAGDYLRKIL